MGIVSSSIQGYPATNYSCTSDERILSVQQLPKEIADNLCRDLTTVEMKKTPFEGVFAGVFFGNPKGEGLSGQIVYFPKDYLFPAHEHPKEGFTTVLSGIFRVFFGEGEDNFIDLHEGESVWVPADTVHYTIALTDVTIQVTGYGPSETHFVEH
jgi:quercetin dioxygenase-like cupin family protein